MSAGDEKGCGSGWCIGAALIIPFFIFATGASRGSLGTVALAVVLGVVLVVIAWLISSVFAEPDPAGTTPRTSEDHETESGDESPTAGKPHGRGITPWVRASKMQKTVGEFYRQASYEAIADQHSIAKDGERTTLDVIATVGLDHGNKHARHGTAITIWAEGHLLGYLPDDVVRDYLDVLNEIDRAGLHLTTNARIYLAYNKRKRNWSPNMVVRLPAPEEILPLNGLPPCRGEVIPDGPSIQVVGEENHQDVLEPLADPLDKTHYAATLRRVVEKRARSTAATIEISIDGERIGTLTPTSAAKVGPLVDLIEAAGLEAYARVFLTTTEKGVQAALRVTRENDAPASWTRMVRARATHSQRDHDAQDGGS